MTLVWRKGNIEKTVAVLHTVLCTVIMVHKGTSSSYRMSTVLGFVVAWFNSLSSECLCVFGLHGAIYIYNIYIYIFKFLLISFSLPRSEPNLV